ncbi:MAG: excalibur calcium-binding domain-containing protein [Sciscionella sp.]
MSNSAPDIAPRSRQWIWGSAGVVAFLGLVGACGGAGDGSVPPAASTAPSSSAVTSTPAPQGKPMTVTEVVDADTVRLVSSAGHKITTQLLGIEAPQADDPNRLGCFGSESAAWAQGVLLGKQVRVTHDPNKAKTDGSGDELVYLRLPSGNDYSVQAARFGYAKSTTDSLTKATQIAAAASTAESASRGLWGTPCYGDISVPVETPDPAPAPVQPDPGPVEEPPTGGDSSVYYKNCAAARAAGAAPVHVGDPGYAPHLDRDGDGVGCEN